MHCVEIDIPICLVDRRAICLILPLNCMHAVCCHWLSRLEIMLTDRNLSWRDLSTTASEFVDPDNTWHPIGWSHP